MNGSTLPTANKYMFAYILLFTSGQRYEATSPYFVAENGAIGASSASLEVLIASLVPAGGIAKETTFSTTGKLLTTVESFFSCANG